jgi:hypothetical protein
VLIDVDDLIPEGIEGLRFIPSRERKTKIFFFIEADQVTKRSKAELPVKNGSPDF